MDKNKKSNKRKAYDSDLTDKQWEIIAPLIPPAKPGGRKRTVNIREVISAIIYVLRSGCVWRLLPNDFPKWQAVYYYFSLWKKDGTWKKIHDEIRGQVRVKVGKKKEPTAGVIDSQSVKTTEKGGFVAMMLVRK
jgi:putative transposase